MKEDLLHFIWQSRILMRPGLRTTTGEPLTILSPGMINTDAGPDFFNAKIRIGNTVWAGNVEMHIQSGMWNTHRHQHDKKYATVVLHVVYHHDREIPDGQGNSIPTLELRNFIPPLMLRKYELLQKSKAVIPCEPVFVAPKPPVLSKWMERMLIERLQQKCEYIESLLRENNHHWDETFYRLTARHFGMKTNSQAFESLAARLPLTILARHKNSRMQIEALVFGMAGFLVSTRANDPYIKELQHEFAHLQIKYALEPLDAHLWKFSRMRPANFPTVRLAQFASLIFCSSHLLSKILAEKDLASLHRLFETDDNPRLNVNALQSQQRKPRISFAMGNEGVALLLINSVLPMLFWYGKCHGVEEYGERTLEFYGKLRPENNSISRYWEKMGISSSSAFDSQALIQMNTNYCNKLRCLSCAIGNELLLKINE